MNGRRHLLQAVTVLMVVLAVLLHAGIADSFFAGRAWSPTMTALGLFGLSGFVVLIVAVKSRYMPGRHFKRRSGIENSNERGDDTEP